MKPDYEMYNRVTHHFREEMIKQLAANYNKGDRDTENGWLTMTDKENMNEIYYHAGKLQEALRNQNIDQIVEFSADIANLSMMVMDKYVNLNIE